MKDKAPADGRKTVGASGAGGRQAVGASGAGGRKTMGANGAGAETVAERRCRDWWQGLVAGTGGRDCIRTTVQRLWQRL